MDNITKPDRDSFIKQLKNKNRIEYRIEYNKSIDTYLSHVHEYMMSIRLDLNPDFYDNLHEELKNVPKKIFLKLDKSWNKNSSQVLNKIYKYIIFCFKYYANHQDEEKTYPCLVYDFYLENPNEWISWVEEQINKN